MCRTRFTLDDIGGALPYRALRHFVLNLGRDSALWRDKNDPSGRLAPLYDGSWQAAALADLFDAVAILDAHVTAAYGGRRRRPKPYPRPWAKAPRVRHVGSKPIPVRDFESWWQEQVRKVK